MQKNKHFQNDKMIMIIINDNLISSDAIATTYCS